MAHSFTDPSKDAATTVLGCSSSDDRTFLPGCDRADRSMKNPLGVPLSHSTPPIRVLTHSSRVRPSWFDQSAIESPVLPHAKMDTHKTVPSAELKMSPKRLPAAAGDGFGAVPYRGATKPHGVINVRPLKTSRPHDDAKHQPPPPRSPLTSDGRSGSVTATSEGYHSDRANTSDEAIIIREIPLVGKSLELRFGPDADIGDYAKAYASISSPEDVDV